MTDIMMNAKKFITGPLLAYELRSSCRGKLYPPLAYSLPGKPSGNSSNSNPPWRIRRILTKRKRKGFSTIREITLVNTQS